MARRTSVSGHPVALFIPREASFFLHNYAGISDEIRGFPGNPPRKRSIVL